jgi:hypothetical protein
MDFKDMRDSLTPDQIKEILEKYGVNSVHENKMYIQFPTCCHNIEGGSHKLYYYKDSNMFQCYTECHSLFDIFTLVQKMEELRDRECSLPQAIRIVGLDPNDRTEDNPDKIEEKQAIDYLNKINQASIPRINYTGIQNDVLNNFIFSEKYLEPWIKEGITIETLQAFNIKYDVANLIIIIPHRDKDGSVIGVRGRFMSEYSNVKYMPITWGGVTLSHPLRGNLYGLYENRAVIEKSKTVILFESEKSVLKFSSFFGHENNFSVATCGNKVSNEQIQILQDLGVKQVILAFDKDYDNSADQMKVQAHYNDIASRLGVYFTTSVMFDYGNLLGLKDAPIDKGRIVFEELFKYRYYI